MHSIEEIRNSVTQKFASNNFHDGDILLAENAEKLPDYVKLECLGNRYFYKRELQEAVTKAYELLVANHPISEISKHKW